MSSDSPRIAFCGLGRMGTEMVAALVEKQFELLVWNRSNDRAVALADRLGVESVVSPAAAARDADVIFTMLTDGAALLETLDGEDGLLAGAAAGATVIDCSTTGVEAARKAADRCSSKGVRFVDCPVSGSTVIARQGKLGLMAGGDAPVIEEVRPLLEALGTVVHVGPTGAGAAAKVAVNALLHTFSTALSECLVAARTAGVSAEALFDVLAVGVLWNRFLDYKRPAFTDPAQAGVAFDLRTATKDLGLAVDASNSAGLSGSVVERALELHRRALADGFGDRDMAAMASWFTDISGTSGDANAAGTSTPGRNTERN